MTEPNWSLSENGAQLVEVSHEASHMASSAANLLTEREDKLWITGDAPQHVIVQLAASHPPLWYAGWHVWHDYLTNPKSVEIASGTSTNQMTALLLCQALPGAGTQVWKLPKCIPEEHRFVRFKILETFGPGPTYMNNIVLLARDPGPRYRKSMSMDTGNQAGSQTASPPFMRPSLSNGGPCSPDHRTSGEKTVSIQSTNMTPFQQREIKYDSSPQSAVRDQTSQGSGASVGAGSGGVGGGLVQSQPGGGGAGAVFNSSSHDVGIYQVDSRGEVTHHQPPQYSRMNELLRGLDDDIRALKPIKAISPSKNMLLYVPESAPSLPPFDMPDTPDDEYEEEEEEQEQESPKHGRKHSKQSGKKTKGNTQPPETQSDAGACPCCHRCIHGHGPEPMAANRSYEYRLSVVEQAVASLTQSVNHQREDLIMIKRLLLQQATDRRHEVERQMQQQILQGPPAAPAALPGAVTPRELDALRPVARHQINVEFPGSALRDFVEEVMAERLHKQARKAESKSKHRLDGQFSSLLKEIDSIVDQRVQARLEQQPQLQSPPPRPREYPADLNISHQQQSYTQQQAPQRLSPYVGSRPSAAYGASPYGPANTSSSFIGGYSGLHGTPNTAYNGAGAISISKE